MSEATREPGADSRLPGLTHNTWSVIGAILAGLVALTFVALYALSSFFDSGSNPYFGIFLFVVLPPFLVLGVAMIPLGMWREARRRRREGKGSRPRYPVIDFGKRSHRNAAVVFVAGSAIFAVISAFASYGAYHHSESVAFCGTTCHEVMEPEHTTYQNGPHARVACTSCHVGAGADWYVKSKLSGAYQVYSVLAKKYPRPIPTPVHSLRPAPQTCEQCHWPGRVFGAQLKVFEHSLYDDENTAWPIRLLIKTGGGDPSEEQTAGIHWHMNVGGQVEYIARDDRRQEIPWVRVTERKTGRITVYQDEENPLTAEEIAAATPRVMDCVDCHNRPSHIYQSPEMAIDEALRTGAISRSLRGVKALAVAALEPDYESTEQAHQKIADRIQGHYREAFGSDYDRHAREVVAAVLATQKAYSRNFFPRMKARWSEYPDNLGHFIFPGCMRCHGGRHKAEDGRTVTRDCNACHVILSQGSGDRASVSGADQGVPFEHPEDIGDAWAEGCTDCHSGVRP